MLVNTLFTVHHMRPSSDMWTCEPSSTKARVESLELVELHSLGRSSSSRRLNVLWLCIFLFFLVSIPRYCNTSSKCSGFWSVALPLLSIEIIFFIYTICLLWSWSGICTFHRACQYLGYSQQALPVAKPWSHVIFGLNTFLYDHCRIQSLYPFFMIMYLYRSSVSWNFSHANKRHYIDMFHYIDDIGLDAAQGFSCWSASHVLYSSKR